ncbi:hypothetical protein ACFL9U_01685 [Thermodesulfobacteriota bacterium]
MIQKQISDLIKIDSNEDVRTEVHEILSLISSDFNPNPIDSAFNAVIALFEGRLPGYRACNTEYHDLQHTISTAFAQARLIHGAILDGENFSERQVNVSLIAALCHDAGYIQEIHDTEGTGAKYTTTHVRRSMDFLESHGTALNLDAEQIRAGRAMILCTDLASDIGGIEFPSPNYQLLGKMLGAADLLAQMADRTYLERLLFLYHEFREAGVGDYQGEVDILRKTVGFYDFITNRLDTTLDGTDRFVRLHFESRWNVPENLYNNAIENQRNYLQKILAVQNSDPRSHLKREGIVKKVHKKYG